MVLQTLPERVYYYLYILHLGLSFYREFFWKRKFRVFYLIHINDTHIVTTYDYNEALKTPYNIYSFSTETIIIPSLYFN